MSAAPVIRRSGGAAERFRATTVGLLSGALAGLLVGVGARIAMRLIALAGSQPPVLNIGGTLTVLVTGIAYGIAGGVIYGAVRERLPGTGASKGLAFGLLVLLLFGPVYFLADQVGELHVAPLVDIATFSLLFVLGGVIIGVAAESLERRLPPFGLRATAVGSRALRVLGPPAAIWFSVAIASQVWLAVQKVAAILAGD
ncbi:MAG: hypothetical protein ACR2NO_11575 [Chloroflexota bacterium]